MLESGALELRLATGEIYHLGEETVTRVALTIEAIIAPT
jgi:alpha-D-ribose 1-methylphosphonate 5-triphosphate synthase subunit PhnG